MIPNVLFYSTLAILAGVSIVIQQALNANLRGALSSAAWSGFASYAIGLGCMALLALALRDPIPSAVKAGRIPWWEFTGGLFGAIFIGLAIFLVPELGAATFIVLLVTGQMLASVTLDHFGWLGLAQRPIDLPRLIGMGLLIGGCGLIQR
jgi:transporter family-2 protein